MATGIHQGRGGSTWIRGPWPQELGGKHACMYRGNFIATFQRRLVTPKGRLGILPNMAETLSLRINNKLDRCMVLGLQICYLFMFPFGYKSRILPWSFAICILKRLSDLQIEKLALGAVHFLLLGQSESGILEPHWNKWFSQTNPKPRHGRHWGHSYRIMVMMADVLHNFSACNATAKSNHSKGSAIS